MRLGGTTSRGHSGTKAGLAQRAKVGYCPCFTRATHVAIPPSYKLGEFANDKARGPELWKSAGPSAARRIAAYSYLRKYGALPKTWDWAVPSLLVATPPLFGRSNLALDVDVLAPAETDESRGNTGTRGNRRITWPPTNHGEAGWHSSRSVCTGFAGTHTVASGLIRPSSRTGYLGSASLSEK